MRAPQFGNHCSILILPFFLPHSIPSSSLGTPIYGVLLRNSCAVPQRGPHACEFPKDQMSNFSRNRGSPLPPTYPTTLKPDTSRCHGMLKCLDGSYILLFKFNPKHKHKNTVSINAVKGLYVFYEVGGGFFFKTFVYCMYFMKSGRVLFQDLCVFPDFVMFW